MNNRFIKVFWHHMDKGHIKDRLGRQNVGNANMILVGEGGDTNDSTEEKKDLNDPEKMKEEKAQAILAIQKNQEMLQTQQEMIKKVEESRKNALVQQEGLLKSKHVSSLNNSFIVL